MAYLILMRYQWLATWRGLRGRGIWQLLNSLALGFVALRFTPRYVRRCLATAEALRTGDANAAAAMTSLLLLVLTAWLFLPTLSTTTNAETNRGIRARLALLPLSTRELYACRMGANVLHPVVWLIAFESLLVLVPAWSLPRPVLGVGATALFLVTIVLLSWAVILLTEVLSTVRRGLPLAIGAGLVIAVTGSVVATSVFRGGRDALIAVLAKIASFTPAGWAVRAGMGQQPLLWILALVAWAVILFAIGGWAVRYAMGHPVANERTGKGRRRSIRGIPLLADPVAAAAEKELRYLLRSMDSIIAFAVGLTAGVALVVWDRAQDWWLWVAALLTVGMEIAMPMNAFGLDRRATDRYRILPLSGRDVVLSKNAAYFLLVAMQVLPIVLGGAVRHGVIEAVACLAGTGSLVLLYVIWGNPVSIRVPAARAFLSADRAEQSGGILSMFYALLVSCVPIGLASLTRPAGPWALMAGQVLLLGICILFYRSRLPGHGRLFEVYAETMRARLAG